MTAQRALMPDYLRLFALFGIVAVNAPYMAFSLDSGFFAAPSYTVVDEVVMGLVHGLFMGKSYGLFSFMFGVGLAFMMRSAETCSLPFARIYWARMVGLLALGIAHGCLFFPYDILALYAMTGAAFFFLRNLSARTLTILGGLLVLVQIPMTTAILLSYGKPGLPGAYEIQVMTTGTWAEVVALRTETFSFISFGALFYQGFSSLGWFCLGLAALRIGAIDDNDHQLWRRLRFLLAPALAVSLSGGALMVRGDYTWGVVLTLHAAPFATAAYLGVIARVSRPPGPGMQLLLKAGASSLTVYLGQSIILSTVFAPYGLGLWSQLSPGIVTALAFAVTLALIAFVILWTRVFRLGPFEWLLRKITYAGVSR
ncbi:MAG: DUF418 domain-containing protein [Pseudomonadota bacterium]